jgi:hypothetical protein
MSHHPPTIAERIDALPTELGNLIFKLAARHYLHAAKRVVLRKAQRATHHLDMLRKRPPKRVAPGLVNGKAMYTWKGVVRGTFHAPVPLTRLRTALETERAKERARLEVLDAHLQHVETEDA